MDYEEGDRAPYQEKDNEEFEQDNKCVQLCTWDGVDLKGLIFATKS
ncbi:567_t:CDS:2 [Gigaspora margarita]|uniref:567_t:CDS:1 n=1 Tax=Gigaspora margarita TaxID=4874 RepID=A0ABN7UKL7_GIGMA|nr:567_t:CDS:2 [Gigaspora margarita]